MNKIIKNEKLSKDIYKLIIEAPQIAKTAQPGQFVNVYLPGGDLLLPRPFGIADAEGETIEIVYQVKGEGTARLAKMQAGTPVKLLGPNGTGFKIKEAPDTVILAGGGLGIPPLLLTAKHLVAEGKKVIATLGYKEEKWYKENFKSAGAEELNISETGEEQGTVIDLLSVIASEAKQSTAAIGGEIAIYTCGPHPMQKAIELWAQKQSIPTYHSLEARMGCGYGACVGCTIDLVDGTRKKVCTDGPVFAGEDILWT
jgi:dihydroorotate dehydrogenase electron transfer subunit